LNYTRMATPPPYTGSWNWQSKIDADRNPSQSVKKK